MKKQIKQIVFTKPNIAEYLNMGEVDFDEIGEKEVVVKTRVSTISAGTERANLIGDPNVSTVRSEKPNVIFPRKETNKTA